MLVEKLSKNAHQFLRRLVYILFIKDGALRRFEFSKSKRKLAHAYALFSLIWVLDVKGGKLREGGAQRTTTWYEFPNGESR